VQDVWVLLPQPAFSEQPILALLVTFVLAALAALVAAEGLPSPACAAESEARPASVKQTMSFFIMVSVYSNVAMSLSNSRSGRIVKADPDNRIAFRCNLNADAMSF
jgi:hypothetical protein